MRSRRGFTLLELMVALGMLVTMLALLMEVESNAALMVQEAESVVIATDLAQAKYNEARLRVEEEGLQVTDVVESGDFSDFGGDADGLDFGQSLKDFHFEYTIAEIDLGLASDLAGMASEVQESGMFGGGGASDLPTDGPAGGGAGQALGMMGMGSDQLTQMLGPYIREIRVRVWWGEDSDLAEEMGNEVIVTGHVVNPTGVVSLEQGAPPQ